MLPVMAEIGDAIGKDVGDVVTVKLEEPLEPTKFRAKGHGW